MTITINEDKEHVRKIRDALKKRDNHCPCQIIINEETRCICKDFLGQEEDGWCHCKLYYKTN